MTRSTSNLPKRPAADRPDLQLTLNEILHDRPGYRRLFENLGIDANRVGTHSLGDICHSVQLHPETMTRLLAAFPTPALSAPAPTIGLELMTLAELCHYLETVHHAQLKVELVRLDLAFRAVRREAGEKADRLDAVQARLDAFSWKLLQHLRQEVDVIFPLIRQLNEKEPPEKARIMTQLEAPLAQMKREHREVDEEFELLQGLALDARSSPPFADDRPQQVLADSFQRFEVALHGEIYQENQILFRRVSALSKIR